MRKIGRLDGAAFEDDAHAHIDVWQIRDIETIFLASYGDMLRMPAGLCYAEGGVESAFCK